MRLELNIEGEGSNVEILQCCEFSQPTEFRRLRNFANGPVSFLTNFLTAFCDFFFPICPQCNLVVSYFFEIYLTLSSI